MKVQAYRCDHCGRIREDDCIIGVIPSEDLFERLKSFPITSNNDKTNCHYCTTCYEAVVLSALRLIDRRKDEHLYAGKMAERQYLLRSTVVENVRKKKKFPRLE